MIDFTPCLKKNLFVAEWVKKRIAKRRGRSYDFFLTRTNMMQNEYGNENEVNACVVFNQNLFLPFQDRYDIKMKDRVSEELLDRTSKSKKINLT
jgi:hypothetical protein